MKNDQPDYEAFKRAVETFEEQLRRAHFTVGTVAGIVVWTRDAGRWGLHVKKGSGGTEPIMQAPAELRIMAVGDFGPLVDALFEGRAKRAVELARATEQVQDVTVALIERLDAEGV